MAVLIFSAASARDQFLIESELWIDGQLRAQPVMVVKAGEPAMMTHLDGEDLSQEEAWRLELEVEPDGDRLSPVQTYWISVTVQQFTEGRWEYLAESIMGVPEGEYATMSVVDGDQVATPETAQLYLRMRTSRLRHSD